MKLLKIVAVVFGIYVAAVALFDSVVGYIQPQMATGVVLTTTDAHGQSSNRTLAGVHLDNHLYVAANHWSRFWYYRALANPAVEVTENGKRGAFTAVPVTGVERDQIAEKYNMGFVLRLICGFAPQRFMRLDPR